MKQQGHYQIAGFSCGLCGKEVAITYQLKAHMEEIHTPRHYQPLLVCKHCSVRGTPEIRVCQKCGKDTDAVAIVIWHSYPLQEIANHLHKTVRELGKEELRILMEHSTNQRWCEACIYTLVQQALQGEVDIFEFPSHPIWNELTKPDDTVPTPIRPTLLATVKIALIDRSWIDVTPTICIFHHRDGGYFIENTAGSPPLEEREAGALSAIVRKEINDYGLFVGLIINVYDAHLDGSIESGSYSYKNGEIIKKQKPLTPSEREKLYYLISGWEALSTHAEVFAPQLLTNETWRTLKEDLQKRTKDLGVTGFMDERSEKWRKKIEQQEEGCNNPE